MHYWLNIFESFFLQLKILDICDFLHLDGCIFIELSSNGDIFKKVFKNSFSLLGFKSSYLMGHNTPLEMIVSCGLKRTLHIL